MLHARELVESNALVIAGDDEGHLIATALLGEETYFFGEHFGRELAYLIPMLQSNRTILYQDKRDIELIPKLLKKVGVDPDVMFPPHYLESVSEDLRYTLYPFSKDLVWDVNTYEFKPYKTKRFDAVKTAKSTRTLVRSLNELSHRKHYLLPETVYLSGPITNSRNYNRNFRSAEEMLTFKGYTVLNPVEIAKEVSVRLPPEILWRFAMELDIEALTLKADEVCLIPNEDIPSKGVAIEKKIAASLGLPINPLSYYRDKRASKPKEDNYSGLVPNAPKRRPKR